ncbi:TcpE family conjugal transfer membrane protein [Sphaerisporangium sp. NPDC049002]|uniref:TcpE family conjugal transfer membrane protein n=1 Tax=Sphaerisporangium sp. NPDC049002 TaxID=3155392 RepID=UPI0033FE184E
MDLPTYTNIWRIEKRLYKLYDLRLPMPLPIVWIGVFVGVLVPWSILLWLVRIPFDAPWHVLYLVPPGVVTWLSTRPVIESKRLNELLQSQIRYLGEPKAWCRLAPVDEPDEITFSARVWRSAPQVALLASADTAKSAARARRGARAKPRHTAPRRKGLEVWSPSRQLPSVKAGSRRGAAVPGEVRPAVAAAAAAVHTLPAAEAPVRLSERPRLTWGAVATPSVPGQSAPGLPPVTSPDATMSPLALEPPRPTSDRVTEIPPKPGPDRTAEVSKPDRVIDVPVRKGDRVAGVATPKGDRVADVPVPKWVAPVEGLAMPPASPQADRPVQEPATAETGGAAPATAPIGTEALRRLRRLAASAESRGPATPRPQAVSSERRPAAPEPHLTPSEPEVAAPEPEPAVSERELAVSEPQVAVSEPRVAISEREPAVSEPRVAASEREMAAPEPQGGTLEHAAAGGVSASVDPDAETEVREQHRKGQPPRPAAYTRLPEARTVWPVSRSRTPETVRPETVRSETVRPETVRPGVSEPVSPRSPVRPAAREQAPPPLSIRAVPGPGTTADPAAPSVPVPVPRTGDEPRVRRVESVVGRDQSGGWRRLAQVVVGGGGPSRNDGIETDEARARTVLTGSRRVVVLGCTGGAGQTTTTLMLGHTLARYREDRVVAVDANTGDHTLTGRIPADSPETLTSLLAGLDGVSGYLSMRAYTTRCESGLEVIASDSDTAAARRLADQGLFSDQRLAQAMRVLDRHYRLILVDPAAAVAARMLPYADQLILVAPASEDAPDAVAMTFDWLDGHGSTELRRRAIMVINGVSRRSMGGVEQAEAVARGRCRAIVRVPWEDELAPGHPGPAELTHLRAGGRRAYVALAGVVASGLAAASRPSEEEVAQ